jgi:hypothetical protein
VLPILIYFELKDFNEELLLLHEEKVAELQAFYTSNESLFALITRRETILDHLYELEGSQFEQGLLFIVECFIV